MDFGKLFTETNEQKFSLRGVQCQKICSHPRGNSIWSILSHGECLYHVFIVQCCERFYFFLQCYLNLHSIVRCRNRSHIAGRLHQHKTCDRMSDRPMNMATAPAVGDATLLLASSTSSDSSVRTMQSVILHCTKQLCHKQLSPVINIFLNNTASVHTRAPLSPVSTIWYQSRGGDALCMRI